MYKRSEILEYRQPCVTEKPKDSPTGGWGNGRTASPCDPSSSTLTLYFNTHTVSFFHLFHLDFLLQYIFHASIYPFLIFFLAVKPSCILHRLFFSHFYISLCITQLTFTLSLVC